MRHFVLLDAYADAGETAAINQIKTIGSMGVLLQAKRAGLVASIAPLLALIDASPVFISRSLLETVLELAGESDSLRDLLP